MFRIDDPAAPSTPPAVPAVGTPNGYFQGPIPGVSQGIVVPDWWLNEVQEELINGVTTTNLAPAKPSWTQLSQSMRRLSGAHVTSVSANTTLTPDNTGLVLINAVGGAITVTLPDVGAMNGSVAGATLNNAMRFRFLRTDTSASAVTLATVSGQQITAGAIAPAGSLTIPPVCSGDIVSNGSGWYLSYVATVSVAQPPVMASSSVGVTLSPSATQIYSVSFTAPRAGTILAIGTVNANASLAAGVQANLKINGTIVAGDATVLSMSFPGIAAVAAGAACTVELDVTNTSGSASVGPITARVAAIFVPTA